MPYFTHNNADIWYEFRGQSGAVVTFINGHTRTLADYDSISPGLLAAGFRVLAFDNRGSGKTKSDLNFSCRDLVDDVTALWRHLNISKSHLVGFSLGGYLAQAVTLCHQEYIDRLILLSTSPGDHFVNHENDSWITDTSNLQEKLFSFFSPTFIKNNESYMHKMLDLTRKAIEEGRFVARAEAQKNAIFGFPVENRLGDITVPTLLMHGRIDCSVFPAAAEELNRKIKGSSLIWLDDTAHFSVIERPKEVLNAMLTFLDL